MVQANTARVRLETSSNRSVIDSRRKRTAFYLAFFPGLLGMFGLGHMYLGRRVGRLFLGYTAVLYSATILALLFPNITSLPILPTAWFLGFLFQLINLSRSDRPQATVPKEAQSA